MRILSALFIFLSVCSGLRAQNAEISGRLTDNHDVGMVGVNAVLKEINKGSQSDVDGNFIISEVPPGNYTLRLSYIGFKTQEVPVSVAAGETKILPTIVLYEGNELLQEVTVTGDRYNKFSRKGTAYVSKLPLKDLENSQVYTTITSELLESQVVTNFDDAIQNATGMEKRWEATGRSGDGTGYYTIRGFSAQPAFVDGVPGFTFSAIDPSYIERIEVLKGPSATLFGSTVNSLGGLINVVTKKPYEGFGGSVSYTVGSFDMHRVSVDVNTPLGSGKAPYFRLNTSYLTQGSFQDHGLRNTFFVAPSFSYRVNNRLNFSLGLEYSHTKQTNASMIFVRRGYPMVSHNVSDFGIDPKKSFTDNDIFLENPTFNGRLIGDYKISKQWTSQTIISNSNTKSEGYYSYMMEGAGVFFLNPNPQTPQQVVMNEFIKGILKKNILTRVIQGQNSEINNLNLQQNFIGDFKIGTVRNRMVVGLDYVKKDGKNRNKALDPMTGFPVIYGFFLPNGDPIDSPLTPISQEKEYPINRSVLDPMFEKYGENHIDTRSQIFAAYVSDVVNITPSLSAMIGLRLDHFDQEGNKSDTNDDYTKTNLSPKFGVVYQALPQRLSLFGNYQTGFINIDPAVSIVNNKVVVQTFDPQQARQMEAGVKMSFFKGKLSAGLSYYDILVMDRRTGDPNTPLASVVIDEMVSKGIEIEVNASPVRGLNIRASYAYNDTEMTKTKYTTIKGRRPSESGSDNLYGLWADYKFQEGCFLKNFGVGAGLNGASKYLTMDNEISGEFELPAYTVINASLYYDNDKFRIGLKGNNLTDEVYYKGWGTINPQRPRAYMGTVAYKF